MNKFTGFLRKEFYHILRDRRTLLILFGMPIVQILLFGFAITNEIRNAGVAVIDHSHDETTQQIIQSIAASDYFTIKRELKNDREIASAFRTGDIRVVVIFSPKFSSKLNRDGQASVQIIADASEPNTANTLVSYLQAIIRQYNRTLNADQTSPMLVSTESRMLFNPELKGVFMFVPGVITIILMLISTMLTSISIAREKETGTMEVLMVSPLRRLPILLGKVFPYLLLSFINANVILLLGKFVFGMPVKGSIVLLLAECLLFVLTALSLGILISTVAKTQQTAMFMSMVGLMLPTIMLSGFIFPIESMPLPLRIISHIIPARWFILIIKAVMLKGLGLQYVWPQTLVLFGMTVFFLAVSARKFKMKLD